MKTQKIKYELVNVSSVGTMCGWIWASSPEEARRLFDARGNTGWIGIEGRQILFSVPMFC